MGVWGPGPLDSDQALDWLADIEEVVAKKVGKALSSDSIDPLEGRAAVEMLLRIGAGEMTVPYLGLADQFLTNLAASEEWLSEWTNGPDDVLESIAEQAARVLEEIERYKETFAQLGMVEDAPSAAEEVEESLSGDLVDEEWTGEVEGPTHTWDPEHERWVPVYVPPEEDDTNMPSPFDGP